MKNSTYVRAAEQTLATLHSRSGQPIVTVPAVDWDPEALGGAALGW